MLACATERWGTLSIDSAFLVFFEVGAQASDLGGNLFILSALCSTPWLKIVVAEGLLEGREEWYRAMCSCFNSSICFKF